MKVRLTKVLGILILFSMLITPFVLAEGPDDTPANDTSRKSHRLIVQLESDPLVVWAKATNQKTADGQLNLKSATAQQYVAQLKAEQNAFFQQLTKQIPNAQISEFINEFGVNEAATYQVLVNGLSIDAGEKVNLEATRRALLAMPGVKNVYYDYAYTPDLYTSTQLINAPVLWEGLGGQENAGAGVKVASMDGGIHKDAPMFDGTGFTFPADFPPGGLGLTENNNGKIIASRTYFRAWDPPSAGDENPWPGLNGTSHGVHTSGIAGGNIVTDVDYAGATISQMSGVAPAAWMMSYRVFYNSVTNNGSFYTTEGVAALEDIVMDGADVVNNSWGGGPGSIGGEFDILDMALTNAVQAGTFVSMSAGNAGPGLGTGDHPSPEYINVAASSTSGTFATGRLHVSAPTPISNTLQNIPFSTASFGALLPIGASFDYDYVTGMSVDPTNFESCNPWPAGSFAGKAAIISRGGCEFGLKVLNAEQAGAVFVVVHNHAAGGEGLVSMGGGAVGNQVTVPAIFVGNTHGLGIVAWHAEHGNDSQLTLDNTAFQAGNTPDQIIAFSSRGPGVGNVLKPDIAAPGVNIMSQGYAVGASGEDRHLGFGQVSGTSMASPHVAGSAALLRQMHPTWSNAEIKSALMSTSEFMNIYNFDGSPAQPLDMGAGRLNLEHADDPGLILDPPSLSYGLVTTGTNANMQVVLHNISDQTETYDISTLYTGQGFAPTQTTSLAGFSIDATAITLDAGEMATLTVTFDSTDGLGMGDNQGYIIMAGETHHAHMPVWARVTPAQKVADVLVIDNDFSDLLGIPNYVDYYTQTLEALGYTYEVWNADANFNNPTTIPDVATLLGYDAVIYFTGDNFNNNGDFSVATPLTQLDMDRLTTYANNGGILIAMGQDMSAVLASDNASPTFFYNSVLGGNWVQDSVTGGDLPTALIEGTDAAPPAFQGLTLDLSSEGDGAHNQFYIDELNYLTNDPDDPNYPANAPYVPLFRYPYDGAGSTDGTVAIAHRDQPMLEKPGISYNGRSIYTSFGLEGVNTTTTREAFIGGALNWAMDEPGVIITATVVGNVVQATALLDGPADLNAMYRWDFGDGTEYVDTGLVNTANHTYNTCGVKMVRVEVTNSWGNKAVHEIMVNLGAANDWCAFWVNLKGTNEVPPVSTLANGYGAMVLDTVNNDLYYRIRISDHITNVEGSAGAHLHIGMPGENGGVAVTLYDGTTTFDPDETLSGVVTLDGATVAELLAGNIYVNVHTTQNPGGEIRGQVMSYNPPTNFGALLLPEKQVHEVVSDASGWGDFVFDVDTTDLSYDITTTDLFSITSAHIHQNWADKNGPVHFFLFDQGGGTGSLPMMGTVHLAYMDIVDLLVGYLYVNIHTDSYGAGEIRGQIERPANPEIFLSKTVGTNPATCAVGNTISVLPNTEVIYCYMVHNVGDVPFSAHDLWDDQLGWLMQDFAYDLMPGETVSITATATYTQAGMITNMATFTATKGSVMAASSAEAHVTVQAPAINLVKTVGTSSDCMANTSSNLDVLPGTMVTYCYQMHNVGGQAVVMHHLIDDVFGEIIPMGTELEVAPGASTPYFTHTQVMTALGTVVNTAVFTSWDMYGNIDWSMDMASVTVAEKPILTVTITTPNMGTMGTAGLPMSFTAHVQPEDAATPITYVWMVTGPETMMITDTTMMISNTQVFTFTTPGTYNIKVTASNQFSEVSSDEYMYTIMETTHRIYLPLIAKGL